MDLKQIASCKAQGTIIEAKQDRGGSMTSLLIQKGTLKVGDYITCGKVYGRIKRMVDDYGKFVKTAGPSDAVEI